MKHLREQNVYAKSLIQDQNTHNGQSNLCTWAKCPYLTIDQAIAYKMPGITHFPHQNMSEFSRVKSITKSDTAFQLSKMRHLPFQNSCSNCPNSHTCLQNAHNQTECIEAKCPNQTLPNA